MSAMPSHRSCFGSLVLVALLCACSGDGVPADLGPAPDGPAPDAVADAPVADAGIPDLVHDSFVPFAFEITVEQVPVAMNGSQPFTNLAGQTQSFTLTVPRHGFAVDLTWRGSRAQPGSLEVTASADLGDGAQQIKAGTNLAPRFGGQMSWQVPPELQLPVGPVTFSASMSDGTQTLTSSVTVNAAEKTFLLDPFRLEDTWLLVFDQDLYTIQRSASPGNTVGVSSQAAPNGVPDFDEDLRLLGFGTSQMLPAAAATQNLGVTGTNAIVRAWVQQEMLKAIRAIYRLGPDGSQDQGSVRIRILVEGEPGAPKLADFQQQVLQGTETQKAFSAIAIGGGDLTKGYVGMSKTVDLRNLQNEDDLGPAYGAFTTSAIAMMLDLLGKDPLVQALLGQLLGQLLPELGHGGKPVGEEPMDAQILAAGFDPANAAPAARDRYDKLRFMVETLGRLAGTLVAHEMGHGLGLVANGPPPAGLFGGEKNASFVNADRTTSVHIDTPGFNVMQAGPGSAPGAALNVAELLTTPSFNALNLAYLRGRVLLLP